MPFVQSGDARIHWESEGQGIPILLIMGHLYSSAMWYPLLPALTGYRVIRFDNRGTGRSDTTAGVTVEQMAADALAVLDAAGEANAHVYGVSMGGGIAGEFGMAYPDRVRSLTLGCTMLKTAKNRLSGMQTLMYAMPRWMIRAVFKKAKPEGYGTAAPRDRALRDIEVLSQDRFMMKGVREQARAIANYAASPERAVARLTMPVLVLHGDEDKLVPVEKGRELAATIPGSIYVEFAGAGHNYLVAANEASTAAFLDFIAAADRT